jgi:superfamily II DNA or RNA helicase
MSKVTIWLKDEINCTIMGLSQEHHEYFHNKFAYNAKNYFFNPKYKLGVWDGKIQFYSKTGVTYLYLLKYIIPKLRKWDYEIVLKDDRKAMAVEPDPIADNLFADILNEHDEPYMLRWYQVAALNAIISKGGGIMIAGTGAGKTIMSAAIAKTYGEFGLKVITIVPSTTLVEQSSADFKMWNLDCGQYCGDTKELNHTHLVTTWQSLQNVPTILKKFDVVVVDECHGAKANVLAKLLKDHGSHIGYRFGMTGTMPDDELDNLQVRLTLGDVHYEIAAHTLIDQGFLSTIDINVVQMKENFEDDYFPDYASESNYLRSSTERTSWIGNFIEEKSQVGEGNTLVLVSSVSFGKKLVKQNPDWHFVYGKDKTKARKEIYDLFKTQSNLVVITTVQVAGTGLSIDRIFNLVYIDIGKSFVRVIQAVGRGLRKNSKAGKDHCQAYDICSTLKYSKQHLRKRTKFYNDSQYPHNKKIIEYSND